MLCFSFNNETMKIYNLLLLTETEENDLKKIINSLETFAKGIINEMLERHKFNRRIQENGERFDDLMVYICADLKKASLGKPAINSLGIAKLEKPKKYIVMK